MSNLASVDTVVDLHIFPLPIIQNALYGLSDHIDGRIQAQEDDQVHLILYASTANQTAAEMERELNAALLAASVNEQAFRRAAPIRNYLAQTAFSITTENQQTIEEFVTSIGRDSESEHAGAPIKHINIQMTDDQAESTVVGNRLTVDKENERVLLQLDGRKYLLPDVLWAAHEMRGLCTCSISHRPWGQLLVLLEPDGGKVDLGTLSERFEHWLSVALERSL